MNDVDNNDDFYLRCSPISDDDMLQVNQAVATKYHSSTNNNETTAKRKSVCVEEESLEDALFAAQVSGQGYV